MKHNVPRRVMPLNQIQFNNEINFIECSEQEREYIDLKVSLKQGRIKKVKNIIEQLKENYDRDYFYYLSEAALSGYQEEYDRSIENINKALKIKQDDYGAYYLKSLLLLEKFTKKNIKFRRHFLSRYTEFKTKDKEEVKQIIETLRKVILLNPDLPYAYNMIVTFMLMLPKFIKDSLDYAKRAIEEMKDEDLYTNLEHA